MIIPITEENISAAGAIHAAAWRQSHAAICSPEFVAAHTAQRQTEYLRREMAQGKQLWLLLDPEPTGLVSLWGGLIENLYVLPEKQGLGYGRELLRFVMSQCSHPRLTVLNTNEFAYGWYLREGFIPSGVVKTLSDALSEIEMVWEGACHVSGN